MVTFALDQSCTQEITAAQEIPGVAVRRGRLIAGDNARRLVRDLCPSAVELTVKKPPPYKAHTALPWIREWVPEFLTHYQRSGVKCALEMGSCLLLWAAGSGKTLAALVWILSAGCQVSVVATKAAIRPTWKREIETYCQGVDLRVLEGRPEKLERLKDRPIILVVSYQGLPDWFDVIRELAPLSVVFDESHVAKSHKRFYAEPEPDGGLTFSLRKNRAAACYRLSRCASRRLATTATPIQDRVRDLWAQLDLIHPQEWGSYWAWVRRYAGAKEALYGMDDRGSSNLRELKSRIELVSHRVPYSVSARSLPPKRRLVTYLSVAEQVRPEGGIAREIKAAAKRGATALLEARIMEAAGRKRKVVLAHARDALEAGLKVVIFTGRRADCERLAREVEAWPEIPALLTWCGHGGQSPEERENMRAGYMRSNGPALLIGTGDAWGEGLDLQNTHLALFAMLPYTPGKVIQWEGRFCRLGQKTPVLIRYLICESTVDEDVAAILLGKLPGVERVIGQEEIEGMGRILVGATEEELLNSLCEKVLGET